ncbi:UDP-N-acetyl-D-glucosamine dehydrogenase [Microbacterium foliorum]|uniref:UDP-N-acetyl-D-glucosamine dehydrogenase n=1 Tax=Microbacterium foliorum TaxID=104336 RepID=A0ABU1HXE7_9MICO|nr:nucleotide sugar dehydrogenase [Microbacterium foliorum]MDR6143969.1 UDP-N-acetyl-D-glucosamine dehydrogenase [Microbacterium foliorum]
MTEENRREAKKVVVIGQGYVGLPVAMRSVAIGHHVVGLDLDPRRVASLGAGSSHVDDISDDELRAALDSGHYRVSSDYADAAGFDVAVITVPTPLRETLPDLSFIESAAESLAPHLTRGALVVLESTTYPGTTQELLIPLLEEGSGLTAGADFFAGYSPERIDPGNPTWGLKETPKIVSGIDQESLTKVSDFYSAIVDTIVPVSSPKEAEMAKLLENTFRHVNIALVNELAVFAHALGVNVWESIDAAATKPFGFMKFTPGPGVGGHCLPVDPSYLSWQVRRKLGKSFRFVELANDVNDHMPEYVLQRVSRRLNEEGSALNGARVLLLGLAYKKNTGDIRESPALPLIELLQDQSAVVHAVDSHVEEHHWPRTVERIAAASVDFHAYDVIVLITDHDDVDYEVLEASGVPVFDTRNRLSGEGIERL